MAIDGQATWRAIPTDIGTGARLKTKGYSLSPNLICSKAILVRVAAVVFLNCTRLDYSEWRADVAQLDGRWRVANDAGVTIRSRVDGGACLQHSFAPHVVITC
jgi:hypothetical protein